MEYPLVTVLMPVFNAEKYLKEAIESILCQTYANFEFLIINDGSVDKSLEIINTFNDERIRLLNFDSNQGLIFVLNYGLKEAKGSYIARMDADDIAYPKRLEKQVALLNKESNVGIVASYTQVSKRFGLYYSRKLNSNEIKCRLIFDNILPHPTVMYKTEVLKRHALNYKANYIHAEDYAFWLEAIEHTNIGLITESLLFYREHENQISKRKRTIQMNSVLIAQSRLFYKMGFTPTKEEELIHLKIFFINYTYDLDFLKMAENWLLKLKLTNNSRKLFPINDFNKILAWTWFEICTDFSSKKFRCRHVFMNSELYISYAYSKYYLIKFELKNLIANKSL